MQSSGRRNQYLILLILFIGLSAYAGFRPLFETFTSGAVKEFIAALFGTVFTIVLTMILLNKQTEVEEQKARGEAVFLKRASLYFDIIERMRLMMPDGQFSKADIHTLDSIFYNLQLISTNAVIARFVDYYRPIKKRVVINVGAQAQQIDYTIPMQKEDRAAFGSFINECRVELMLSPIALPPELFDAIKDAIDMVPEHLPKRKRAERKLRVLAELSRRLEDKGGPENDGALFEEVISIQEDLMDLYGLPTSSDFYNVMFDGKDWLEVAEIDAAITRLETASAGYMKQTGVEGRKALVAASEANVDPLTVLPKAGFTNHSYQIFLYERLATASPRERLKIFEEMERAEDHLNDLGRLEGLYQDLAAAGLNRMDAFLNQEGQS